MKNLTVSTAMVIFACIFMTLAGLACHRADSYSSFLNHDQKFYESIAKACSDLLANTNYLDKKTEIDGENDNLPTAIRKIWPSKIVIASNQKLGTNIVSYVWIAVGKPREDYTIIWRMRNFGDNASPWDLSVSGEGLLTTAYSQRSSLPSQPQLKERYTPTVAPMAPP